jgi:hypothetical protein
MSEHQSTHWVQNIVNDPRVLFSVNENIERIIDQEDQSDRSIILVR